VRTIEDCDLLIRDWVEWSGCSAWRTIVRMADDAHRIRAYDLSHPEKRTLRGEVIGGPRNAALALRAERRYRLAAWVLRRIDEGREAFDDAKKVAEQEADYARIMGVQLCPK
jgi:hypothetical protein